MPEIRDVLIARRSDTMNEDDPRFDEDLSVWFGSASLYAGRAVEAAFCDEWLTSPSEPGHDDHRRHTSVKHLFLSLPVSGAPPWNGPISLDDARPVIRAAIRRSRMRDPRSAVFRFALARWFFALNKPRRTLEDAVLDLTIALEAVFVLEDGGDRAKAVRERVSRWFCDGAKGKPLRDIKDRLFKVYDVRSRIVHGVIVEASRLEEARSVLDQLLRELLLDYIEGHLDDFDPSVYWPMPPTERCAEAPEATDSA